LLNAEIEVLAVKRGETVTARLAPPEVYNQANAQFNPALVGTRITVEKRPNGDLYLKATTPRPIQEPFIELIIELNSESGRVTRQYTALLDPPGYGRAAGEIPPRAETPEPAVASAAEPPPRAAPAGPPKEAPVRAAPVAPSKGAPARAATPPSSAGGGQYGPIKPGETLGGIARIVKPEGVTLEQTLVALHRHNPDAFIRKNMNLVKSGKILKVPEAGEMTVVAQPEAVREVKLQLADFNSFRDRLAERAATSTAEEGGATRGRIGSVVTDAAAADPRDTVRVSRSEPPPGKAAASAKGNADERIRILEEEAIARQRALAEATDRIGQLEKTIKDMQRLAELKTGGAGAVSKAPEPAPKAAAADVKGALSTGGGTIPPPRAEQSTAATAATGAANPAPPPSGENAAAVPQGGAPDAAADAAKGASEGPVAVLPPKAAAPKAAPEPQASPGLMDGLMDEPLYLGVAAAAVLLAILGLLAVRRRRAADRGYADEEYKVAPTFTGRSPAAAGAQASATGTGAAKMPETRATPSAGSAAQPAAPRARGAATDNDLDFDLSPRSAVSHATSVRPATTFPDSKPAVAAVEPSRANIATAPAAAAGASGVREPATPQPSSVSQAAALGTAFNSGGVSGARSSQTAAAPDASTARPSELSLEPAASGGADTASSKASALSDFDLETVPPERRTVDATRAERVSSEPPPRDFEFKLDLDNLDLSAPGEAKSAAPPRDAHWYDVQQKFDLAKAYQEMDNRDGARDILREVLKEGDQEQRMQATQLLAKLG
jgi:pilus assembly protein FimV